MCCGYHLSRSLSCSHLSSMEGLKTGSVFVLSREYALNNVNNQSLWYGIWYPHYYEINLTRLLSSMHDTRTQVIFHSAWWMSSLSKYSYRLLKFYVVVVKNHHTKSRRGCNSACIRTHLQISTQCICAIWLSCYMYSMCGLEHKLWYLLLKYLFGVFSSLKVKVGLYTVDREIFTVKKFSSVA